MTTPWTLRPTGTGDLRLLVDLYRQCEDFIRIGTAAPIDDAMVKADLALSAHEGGVFHGIFLQNGTLAGVADCCFGGYEGRRELAFLILLMVGAPWRRMGLGRSVVSRLEEAVWRNPAVTAFQTAVQVDNTAGITFWEAVGFARISGAEPQPDGTVTYLLEKRRPA